MHEYAIRDRVVAAIQRRLRDLLKPEVLYYQAYDKLVPLASEILEITGVAPDDTARVVEVVLAARAFVKFLDDCLTPEELAGLRSDEMDRLRAALKAIQA